MKISTKTLLLSFVSLLFSCSAVYEPTPPPADFNLATVEIYVSRASMSQKNFEQYKISGDLIFVECGKIAGGRQVSQYQSVNKLNAEQKESVRLKSWDVVNFDDEYKLMLDSPGASDTFYDPGQFILTITSIDPQKKINTSNVKTTLDSVASPSKTSESNLNGLATTIRAIALSNTNNGTLCNKQKFYDL